MSREWSFLCEVQDGINAHPSLFSNYSDGKLGILENILNCRLILSLYVRTFSVSSSFFSTLTYIRVVIEARVRRINQRLGWDVPHVLFRAGTLHHDSVRFRLKGKSVEETYDALLLSLLISISILNVQSLNGDQLSLNSLFSHRPTHCPCAFHAFNPVTV